MKTPLRIGSRQSPLAKAQVKEVLSLLAEPIDYELLTLTTQGDEDKKTSLMTLPADDFFTNTLDKALLEGRIDIAIHSAKDLPKDMPAGLSIFALTKAFDETDAFVGNSALSALKPGARIGTSSLLRQEQIKALYPEVITVDIRGTINERLDLLNSGKVDGLVVASCALKRLGLGHLIKDIFPWEATPLQGQLAIVGREKDENIKALFDSIDVRKGYGQVSLVGAGPGDPGLITLKAKSILEHADCVFYDYLVNPLLLNHAPLAEHIYAGKRKGDHTLSQQDLNRQLKIKAMQGKHVVRLKGGDPLVFGRGGDEITYLSAYYIPVNVVPGVSSATGIPASLKLPLTARGVSQSVVFLSAHEQQEDAKENRAIEIPQADTLVFLMGLSKLTQIVKSLRVQGWADQTPVLIISKGTCIDQRIVKASLSDIEEKSKAEALAAPALIIVGKVVDFYKEDKPRIFLHAGLNPELYTHLGVIVPWPMIEIKPIAHTPQQEQQLGNDFDKADMIVLTSPNAVKHFMPLIRRIRTNAQVQSKIITVIGKHTLGLLEKYGIKAHIIASYETAEGLFETLRKVTPLKDKKILFPRSELPNPYLKENLIKAGALVFEHAVYHNQKPLFRPLPQMPFHGIIFTSPSTVDNFLNDYKQIPDHWQILAKGPVTQAVLTKAGYSSTVTG